MAISNILPKAKPFLYVILLIWVTQTINILVHPYHWGDTVIPLGLSLDNLLLGRYYMEFSEKLMLYGTFIIAAFSTHLFIEKYLKRYFSFHEKYILRTIIVLIVFSFAVQSFAVYLTDRKNDERAQYAKFEMERANKIFIENLENRNVLFLNNDEIEKKYNIAKKGREDRSGLNEKEQSLKGDAKFAYKGSLELSGEVKDKEILRFDVQEGLELKLLSCIQYYFERSLLEVYHLQLPRELDQQRIEQMREIFYSLDDIRWNLPWWETELPVFEPSSRLREHIKALVSGYKSNKFNCLDCTSIEFL